MAPPMPEDLTLRHIRDRVAAHHPRHDERGEKLRAAVAVVLRPGTDLLDAATGHFLAAPELLFIRRAERSGDPWSGHIAFPGGRVEPRDEHIRRAAERETVEEVGLVLEESDYVGRLDDLTGRSESVRVSAFCYVVERPTTLVLNHEVSDAFWVPIDRLVDSAHHLTVPHRYADEVYSFPAVRLLEGDAPVLWGMTYRFVEHFLGLLGREIPTMLWHSED